MGTISVDPDALRTAAQRLDTAADILTGALGAHLSGLRSGAAADRLITDVRQWAGVAQEVAAALRVGADRYADGEAAAVTALR